MPRTLAAARPKTASAVTALTAVLASFALVLFGMASPSHAVGPDALGTIDLTENPLGVAVNTAGDRYVGANYEDFVLVYPDGQASPDNARTLTGLPGPAAGIAFDSTGRTFVSVPAAGQIFVYEVGATTPNIEPLMGDPNAPDEEQMAAPWGLAINSSDELFVANTSTNDDSVYVFDSGQTIPNSSKKIDDADLQNPQSVAINSTGDVFIGADGENAKVWVAPAGTNAIDPDQTKTGLLNVRALGIGPLDELYAANGTSVLVYAAGSNSATGSRTLTGIGSVQGIAISGDGVTDPPGTAYVADIANNKLLRFSPEPVLTVDQAEVNYSDSLVGTTATETITITNAAGADLIMDAAPFTIDGANPARFAVTQTDCADAVLIREVDSCTVEVTFSPTARGEKTANLQIGSSAPEDPYTVPLTGTGVAPVFSSNPGTYSFGEVNVDSTPPTKEFVITNAGDAPLVFPAGSVTLIGTNANQYSITAQTCNDSSVEPAAQCTVTVSFAPTSEGAKAASLRFLPNAPETSRTVDLSGTGTQPGFEASAASHEFTTTVGYPTDEFEFTISSDGTAPLVFTEAVSLSGADSTQFSIGTDTCSNATVAVGEACVVGVIFSPDEVGSLQASLDFVNNAPDSPQSIVLDGYSLPTAPAVSLSASDKEFSNFTLGVSEPEPHSFVITNTGTAALDISSVGLTGVDADSFEILETSDCLVDPVAIDGQCQVDVAFNPSTTGDKEANLRLQHNAPDTPHDLPLTGSAIDVPSAPTAPSASSGADSQVAVNWQAPNDNGNSPLTGYRIQISTEPHQWICQRRGIMRQRA